MKKLTFALLLSMFASFMPAYADISVNDVGTGPVILASKPGYQLFIQRKGWNPADRQLAIDPKVLDFLAVRVERSLAAAADVVAAIDRAALGSGRKISRQLVAEVLGTEVTSD